MDAARLIVATRHALAQAKEVAAVIAEAWQAQALAQAIGGFLAVSGDPGLRDAARALCTAGGRARDEPMPPGPPMSPVRAVRLTAVRDPTAVLRQLLAILAEASAALATVACATEDEPVYWQCIDALDAADDSKDRTRALLRRYETLRRDGPGERAEGGPP